MSYPKVVLVGETNVGKTSLCERYRTSHFNTNSVPTIGAAKGLLNVKVDEETVTLDLWDTAGQERYRSLTPMYFSNCCVAIFVYDIVTELTFASLNSFYSLLKQKAPDSCNIVIVGNKCDLASDRKVDILDVEEYGNSINAKFCMETSAKTGAGVDELFVRVAMIAKESISSNHNTNNNQSSPVAIDQKETQKGKCC